MIIYTIYRNPFKEPKPFVVREWQTEPGKQPQSGWMEFADDLEAARSLIPFGLTQLAPEADDEPTVIENWI
jgi:hypothetical protein